MPNVSTPLEAPRIGDFQPAGADQLAGGFMNRVSHLGQSMVGAVQSSFDRVGDALGDVRMPTLSCGAVGRLAGLTLMSGGVGMVAEMAAGAEDAQAGSHRAHITRVKSVVPGHSSAVDAAQQKYDNDPFRSGEPWVGDRYPNDRAYYPMFNNCTPAVLDEKPNPTFQYNQRQGKLQVRFSSGPFQYCDLMGKTTETVTAQVNGKNKSRQVGQTVVYEDGMREDLARYMPNAQAKKFFRKTVAITGVGNLCQDGKPKTLQVKVYRQFFGNRHQTFQHPEKATVVQSGGYHGFYKWVSPPKNVCK